MRVSARRGLLDAEAGHHEHDRRRGEQVSLNKADPETASKVLDPEGLSRRESEYEESDRALKSLHTDTIAIQGPAQAPDDTEGHRQQEAEPAAEQRIIGDGLKPGNQIRSFS